MSWYSAVAAGAVVEVELAAGDVLHVPRGVVHRAEPVGLEGSVHLTLGIDTGEHDQQLAVRLQQLYGEGGASFGFGGIMSQVVAHAAQGSAMLHQQMSDILLNATLEHQGALQQLWRAQVD